MSSPDIPPPIACTLGAAALGEREGEFRRLFAASLRSTDRAGACTARLVLDAACEHEARDLLAREQRCCAFFAFDIALAGDTLVVDVRVPAEAAASLDFLLALAPQP